MKVKVLMLLLLAGVVGYLLATEKGRGQRDQIVVKVRERRAGGVPVDVPEEMIDVTEAATDAVSDAAADAAETVGSVAD